MSGGPPKTLPLDVFIDHDAIHALSPADADALRAAAGELNRRNVFANQSIDLSATSFHYDDSNHKDSDIQGVSPEPPTRPGQLQFRTQTIAPSPTLQIREGQDDSDLPDQSLYESENSQDPLRFSTDARPSPLARTESLSSSYGRFGTFTLQRKTSSSSLKPISRTPSVKQAFAYGIGSACSSAVPSPIITAMGDVTPLPSPLLTSESPGPWRRLGPRPPSRDLGLPLMMPDSVLVSTNGESVASALAHQSKRKVYAGLKGVEGAEKSNEEQQQQQQQQQHGRNRSISEYVPDPMGIPKRQTTVSGTHLRPGDAGMNGGSNQPMRREPHLSAARGITPAAKPPTPPPSESSQTSTSQQQSKKAGYEYFEARGRRDNKLRRWRAIKKLGEGTFSRVMLATSQAATDDEEGEPASSSKQTEPELKTLVAVKVCEHGPRGGASETRIEMSLKRELEIMQSIHHPSLVHLKAWSIEPTRALLVISYCPGGDLFDVANRHRDLLTPPLLRRMFAELVGAVRYLHERRIVHRDIKLENVLVNVPPKALADPNQDWATYPDSIITLTDLGLSRRVADDEKLETRCGSDDYAAPEVILGQPYDGRAIDAWSMGVLLYALLESRLPFDPPPGASDAHRMRSRTSHRIARIEWRWIEYAGDDGDHDGDEAKFEAKGLKGAMEVTEGLLKRARSRWPLEKVAASEWVQGGIQVEGGPRFKEEEEGEEVL